MSDLPQQNTIVQYVADGITTTYTVPFFTPVEPDGTPDLDVYTQSPTATPIPSDDINIFNVAYVFTPNLDPITGGTITFLTDYIPANGWIVTIVRNVSASLDVEFSQAQTFSGFTLDLALDKLLLISQQNKSYAFDRNLSYIVNSYLPESSLEANVQIPVLQPGYIWIGATTGGVVSALLEQNPNVSTLRSELANNAPITDGATLVGYYDPINHDSTTVDAQLTYLTTLSVAPFPTGIIVPFGGSSAPAGFLMCNGAAVSRVTYSVLFGVIGTAFGDGDGMTTFNVPNTPRTTLVGAGGTGTSELGNAVGDTGGSETETLTDSSQLPSHTHSATTTTTTNFTASNVASGSLTHVVVGGSSSQPFSLTGDSATTIANTGESAPFNIIQPSLITNFIIKT